jgi:superfamily II DNA/RNA helicase
MVCKYLVDDILNHQKHVLVNLAILQKILVVSEGDKPDTLKKVLQELNPSGEPTSVPKCIVFVSRKFSCDDLANSLWNAGYSVDSLHGDKQQFQRTKVMDQFKRGDLKILVATDVAARGLDVKVYIYMVVSYWRTEINFNMFFVSMILLFRI